VTVSLKLAFCKITFSFSEMLLLQGYLQLYYSHVMQMLGLFDFVKEGLPYFLLVFT
jgi:hypothetical protein